MARREVTLPGRGRGADSRSSAFIRVLTASESPEVHSTIARALALLGEQDAASIKLHRADDAEQTLTVATQEKPKIAFLDVTIGQGAGISLVHFLQATVPGLIVIAIVPDDPTRGSDVRLAEQAASLGAAYVLLGELTGDDVLRAFTKVAPTFAPTLPPLEALTPMREGKRETDAVSAASAAAEDGATLPPPRPEAQTQPPAPITDARSFAELDVRLAELATALGGADPRAPLLAELRSAIEQCVVQERAERAPIQDLGSSAYSFAYFVDLAGREIDLARRHGRRFALATVEVVLPPRIDSRATVELVLAAVRDTDVVARADEHELLLLLPETGTKGARTLRRRILERTERHARSTASRADSGAGPADPAAAGLPLRVGLASFPFDGEDLSRLLRIARRRAERWAPLEGERAVAAALSMATAWLAAPPTARGPLERVGPFVATHVPLREAWALFDTLIREATRAGDATIGLHAPVDSSEAPLGLAHSIRASTSEAFGPLSGGAGGRASGGDAKAWVSIATGTSHLAETVDFEGLEVVGILSEHACFGIVGRVVDGHLWALQTHELPIVEALVEGLEQPVLRRTALHATSGAPSSSAPSGLRGSHSDPHGLGS